MQRDGRLWPPLAAVPSYQTVSTAFSLASTKATPEAFEVRQLFA